MKQRHAEAFQPRSAPSAHLVLQRKCACGQHARGGECEECQKKKELRRFGVSREEPLAESSLYEGAKHERNEEEDGKPLEREIPKDQGAEKLVRTVLRKGRQPLTMFAPSGLRQGLDRAKYASVAPGGAPGVNNSAASSDCLPSTASAVLAWNVVSADVNNWRADVTSLTLAGQVNVHPWPSNPTSMVVPNTPNPVDGGNINNQTGSPNHWQAAIADMANYNSPGGGAGPNWHSTAASSAHEWAHWNTDYVADSVSSAAGGNWHQANSELDALTVPKTGSPNEAAARAALQPRVNTRLATWRSRTIARWNAIPDSAGVAGSTGYAAGMAVLNNHISAIRAYAQSKGWTGAGGSSPGAGSTGGLSRGARVGIGIASGAILGAGIGAFGGPVGALIGAGVGALAGGIVGALA